MSVGLRSSARELRELRWRHRGGAARPLRGCRRAATSVMESPKRTTRGQSKSRPRAPTSASAMAAAGLPPAAAGGGGGGGGGGSGAASSAAGNGAAAL